MSVKGEQKSQRRKQDNVMQDTHREFLDMDTDEEDAGRQETLESEEELLQEPERPVYSDQELITLVQYIKEIIILPSFKECDWNDTCDEIIHEYFCNPIHIILCIFYEDDKLTAALKFPEYTVKGLTYFTRPPWHIYTPDNFLSTILFGTITENIHKSALKFVENIYAPVALNHATWPRIMEHVLFRSLHGLLVSLTEETYKPAKLTVLYIPGERLLRRISISLNSRLSIEKERNIVERKGEDWKDFISRLEIIASHWVRQIRNATRCRFIREDVKSVNDEVRYWNQRYFNLNNLRRKLLNDDVCLIIEILKNSHSINAQSFDQLRANIDKSLNEASSNLMYLKLLSNFNNEVNIAEAMELSVTNCLFVILFIWTESTFYNAPNNIGILCRALSTQIMVQCISYIDLDAILGSNSKDEIKKLKKCINYCDSYRSIYKKVVTDIISSINPGKKWDVSDEMVFANIDTFQQRCYDLIEISKSFTVFGGSKVGLFGSPKGVKYEQYCHKVEKMFYEGLNEVRTARDLIFNVTDPSWLRAIQNFRKCIITLENMIKNLIVDVFANVQNIEEGVEAIYALQKFNEIRCLREELEKKRTQVWNLFHKELVFYYTENIRRKTKTEISSTLPIIQYLNMLHNSMISASYWIGDCSTQGCILRVYKDIMHALKNERNCIKYAFEVNDKQAAA